MSESKLRHQQSHIPTVGQTGFTLIELVAVMVILGVLAAVALPQFIDLKDEARSANLAQIEGTMHSATTLVNAQAQIERKTQVGIDTTTLVNGNTVGVNSSYPRGHWNLALRYITGLNQPFTRTSQICNQPLCGVGNQRSLPGVAGSSGGLVGMIWPENYRWNDDCSAYYYNKNDGTYPLIGRLTSGC